MYNMCVPAPKTKFLEKKLKKTPAFLAIMSAPAATSARTTDAVPFAAAQCNGVRMSRLRAFGLASAERQRCVCVRVCVYVCVCVCIYTYIDKHTYICIFVCIYTHTHIHACMHTNSASDMYVYKYVYTHSLALSLAHKHMHSCTHTNSASNIYTYNTDIAL